MSGEVCLHDCMALRKFWKIVSSLGWPALAWLAIASSVPPLASACPAPCLVGLPSPFGPFPVENHAQLTSTQVLCGNCSAARLQLYLQTAVQLRLLLAQPSLTCCSKAAKRLPKMHPGRWWHSTTSWLYAQGSALHEGCLDGVRTLARAEAIPRLLKVQFTFYFSSVLTAWAARGSRSLR